MVNRQSFYHKQRTNIADVPSIAAEKHQLYVAFIGAQKIHMSQKMYILFTAIVIDVVHFELGTARMSTKDNARHHAGEVSHIALGI